MEHVFFKEVRGSQPEEDVKWYLCIALCIIFF
jgi:hypothetical protein